MKKLRLIFVSAVTFISSAVYAQNPYLPLWEYIPDGEPYVFEDPDHPGKYRVYVYGSHDILVNEYCGRDQVVWSAPVDDLSNWRYDGVIFVSDKDAQGNLLHSNGVGDVLYAPDVALVQGADGSKKYYLYPNVQDGGRQNLVAVSDRPDGPFKTCNWKKDNPRETEGPLAFDPAVFVDDDGRVYGYWGFERSMAAELDPETMATVKPGTSIKYDMISSVKQPGVFRFFEASSMRKIEDKYVFVYSRTTEEGEFGLPAVNYTLAYAYSDSPMGPFTYGGTLIDGRARDTDAAGHTVPTACPYGNTHGSLQEINGKWWVFYHRQTGTDEYSRQAMVAPVNVVVEKGKGGKVIISEGEYNSEGFRTEGLNPLDRTPAGLACYLTHPDGVRQSYPNFFFSGSYVKATRLDNGASLGSFSYNQPLCPVVNNTSGSVVGYKYFDFNKTYGRDNLTLNVEMVPLGTKGTVKVFVGDTEVASISLDGGESGEMSVVAAKCHDMRNIRGKQPLFFKFESEISGKSLCEIYAFQFK